MDKNKLKNVCRAAAAVITALCTVLIIFLSAGKTQYHMDEVWTFGLANSYGQPQFYPTLEGVDGLDDILRLSEREDYRSFIDHWHPGSFFGDYVTVQRGERFAYGNVWRNQKLDTSPPFYYALIHTVCSFFPDSFSKWYGLIPNIIFYALSLWLVWLIARQILNDDIKALAALILYGISKAAISDAVFIRMYMLMTFLVLLLVWLFMKILSSPEKKYIFAAAAVSIIGFLTQYYFYVTAFLLTLCTCILLLFRKEIRRAILTGFCELGAVAAAVAIFPAVIDHLFDGPFSEYTSINIRNMIPMSMVFDSPDWYFFTGHSALLLVLGIAALALAALVSAALPAKKPQKMIKSMMPGIRKLPGAVIGNDRIAAAVIITAAYFFSYYFVFSVAPMMSVFAKRYLFPIMPLLAIIIIGSADIISRTAAGLFTDSKKIINSVRILAAAAVIAAAAVNSLTNEPFLGIGDHGGYDIHSAVAGKSVLFMNHDNITSHAFSYDLSSAERVFPIDTSLFFVEESEDGSRVKISDAAIQLSSLKNIYDISEPLIAVVCTDESEEDCRTLLDNAEGFGIELISSTDHLLWEDPHVFVYELTPAGA